MKIILAPNAFKESLTANRAARAMADGFRKILPRAELIELPVADGGDGTLDSLSAGATGRIVRKKVLGPLGEPVIASYALLDDGATAVIELALAAGLQLLPAAQRQPLKASTFGLGQLLQAGIDRGARRVIIGLGGSATVDCGCGLAQALGARLLDERGRELGRGGGQLERLARIEPGLLEQLRDRVEVLAACDVDNPLLGARGGIRSYSPQKGATPRMVERLERGARNFAHVVQRDLGVAVARLPGAGAAGGCGAGLAAFLGARLRSGAELVLETLDFAERARGADLIVTGEGRLDKQTLHGKAPAAVAAVAKQLGIPCIAICGELGPGSKALSPRIFKSLYAIRPPSLSREEAMRRAAQLLRRTAEDAARQWLASDKLSF